MEPNEPTRTAEPRIVVQRWPTELPLLALVALSAAAIWALLFLSLIGFVYAFFIGLFLFFAHLGFIAYVRGSAVRLGPDQFPEIHRRVQELCARAGIEEVPEAYLMEAGGTLNALATKFLRSRMIVLFSDLLDACGDNTTARDMVIGHELGHIKAGHLQWSWLLFPGMLVPFLGTTYSRAREYTCDRYGAALCGDPKGALLGLAILAAGGAHGPRVNLAAFTRQREQLDTGFMTLAKWLGTHPPLCDRVAALEPSLAIGVKPYFKGPLRVVAGVAVLFLVGAIGAGVFIAKLLPKFREVMDVAQAGQAGSRRSRPTPPAGARHQVETDLADLAEVAREYRRENEAFPADLDALLLAWKASRGGERAPADPFDGQAYGYLIAGDSFQLWSAGPDGESGTDDDISVDSGSPPSAPR
ncbi:MAG: M48 family metalloprotease [Solirubrobacterales bacterium]